MNKTVGEILRTLVENFNQIAKTINEFFKQLYDGFNERILPSLKESYSHVEQVLSSLFEELLSGVHILFDRLVDSLKKFEDDFKKISKLAVESSVKFSRLIGDKWSVVQGELEDLLKLVGDYLKSLPGIESIKEKYNEVSSFL